MIVKQIIALIGFSLLAFSGLASAASNYTGPDRDANGNITPTPKGEQCIEDTSYMRKNHMKLLLHKRDQTMHEGIRTKKASLKECIECHATPAENGKIDRVSSGKHFCASCHIAAAVTLDCFECHADRPVSAIKKSATEDLFNIMNNHKPLRAQAKLEDTGKQ